MFASFILYTLAFYCLYKFLTFKNEKPIFGIYTQKSRWYPVKYLAFLVIYYIRIVFTRYLKAGKWSDSGFGVDKNFESAELDRPQPLINHLKVRKAIFCCESGLPTSESVFKNFNFNGFCFVKGIRCYIFHRS